jgi:hypothetical protein
MLLASRPHDESYTSADITLELPLVQGTPSQTWPLSSLVSMYYYYYYYNYYPSLETFSLLFACCGLIRALEALEGH